MADSLFDAAVMDDAALKLYHDECESGCGNVNHLAPARAELERRGIDVVKCGGCGGAILRKVALAIRVDPNRVSEGHCGYSCRQPACVAHVAEELAAEWAIC